MTMVIRPGEPADVPTIAELIRGLARFEKLEDEVSMTEERLASTLLGPPPYAETLIAAHLGTPNSPPQGRQLCLLDQGDHSAI